MVTIATVDDVIKLWRPLKLEEIERAEALIETVTASLIEEGHKYKKDFIKLCSERESYKMVAKSVIIDVVARTLLTSTEDEPMTQFSQSALGYSVSGSYLVPGGGLFIKRSELSRLGFRRQKYGVIDIYDKGN